MTARVALLAVAVVAVLGGTAAAYPQFQLSRDKTCTGCHLSPAGGNVLSENGESVAEGMATLDHSGRFMYGKVPLPDWLVLGGDLRGATGYIRTPENVVATFPMQLELYGTANLPAGFSVHLNAGSRPATVGNEAATRLWSREHYVQWRTNAGSPNGVFARVGRFQPVFGLRFAEHPMYSRRFGGNALFTDTYGAHVAYISEKLEGHLSGFIEDPVVDPVAHANGGAAYAEVRLRDNLQLGAGGMIEATDDDTKYRGTVTAKYYASGPDLLVQAEGQFVNQRVEAGGAPIQLLGNLVVSKFVARSVLLDVGLGHFDSNIRIKDLDRNALDLNVHWFASSHIELLFTGRIELLAFGNGGPSHAYALIQGHYRL